MNNYDEKMSDNDYTNKDKKVTLKLFLIFGHYLIIIIKMLFLTS